MEEQNTNVNRVLEHKNDHALVLHWGFVFPRPLQDRDVVTSCIFQEQMNDDCIISVDSVEHDAAPPSKGVVRINATRLLRFSPISNGDTLLTTTVTFNLGGAIPRFVSDSFTKPQAARAPLDAIGYFLKIKETAEFDAVGKDAKALGQLLSLEMENVRTLKRPEHLEAKLHTFVYRTTVLRELTDVHRWFPKMLFQVLRNLPSMPRTTKAKLADFTERDAMIAGRAMTMLMLTTAIPDAATDEVSRERKT
jgi:hypothetical protein